MDQLNRAARSIATNLAAGNGRFTKADRTNFFIIARGSVQECVSLLKVAQRRGFIPPDQHARLKENLEEMSKNDRRLDQRSREARLNQHEDSPLPVVYPILVAFKTGSRYHFANGVADVLSLKRCDPSGV